MSSTHYMARLQAEILRAGNPIVVGLDPRFDQLPDEFIRHAESHLGTVSSTQCQRVAEAFERFCCRVIDVVAPLVPCVKPQAAFFEEWGPEGCLALARVIRHARRAGLIVICDAKRGDIGSTAEAYARGYLAGADVDAAPWGADALTVNPYLGRDTLQPFVDVARERGGGIYVLVRTSNPGAGSFQDPVTDGVTVYQRMADAVQELAEATRDDQAFGCVGAVVGATYPKELVDLRQRMPSASLLIPGYGSQGGTAADVAAAFTGQPGAAVVNNSRGIIFAHRRQELAGMRWEDAVAAATRAMAHDLKSAAKM